MAAHHKPRKSAVNLSNAEKIARREQAIERIGAMLAVRPRTVIDMAAELSIPWNTVYGYMRFMQEVGDAHQTGGHYGVVPWDSHSGAVSAAARQGNGRWSVADPRIDALPAPDQKTVAIIRALDGTWHRPFTTLELAALQSLIEPEEYLLLDGMSDSVWREHIGNLVPPDAACAIAEVMGTTLLLASAGETFVLSSTPIWVRNVALALTLPGASS